MAASVPQEARLFSREAKVSSKKRSHKIEKLARIYDDQILPVWALRFGKMLLRDLPLPDRGQILDVACGTGYPATEILEKMGPKCRLIAIDGSSTLLDVARKKVEAMGKKGVFFRSESAEPKLSFANEVYDLVLSNLGLMDMDDRPAALKDFARVTVPGGQVRCTIPLEGTFQEFNDIYREVLIKHDKHEALSRLNQYIAQFPTVDESEKWLHQAGLQPFTVEVEEFSLLFKSSREFFYAPVIEYGPLAEWKEIAGKDQEMRDIFFYIKESIDAYFGNRAFKLTIRAGCLKGIKPLNDEDRTTDRIHLIDAVEAFPGDSESEIEINPEIMEEILLEAEDAETLQHLDPIPEKD